MDLNWTEGPLAEGLLLYNAGEYFTAHEAWETVWLRAPEPEKTFLQGVIQVTAAFHHLSRENRLGAELLLKAALGRIEPYPASFGGISVGLLCNDIQVCLLALEGGKSSSEITPPGIALV